MKTSIEKRRKHAAELLAMLDRLEKDAAKDEDLDGYRHIIAHYDKAIKILRKKKHNGQAITDLITEWSRERGKLNWYIALKIVSRLKLLKTNLETELES